MADPQVIARAALLRALARVPAAVRDGALMRMKLAEAPGLMAPIEASRLRWSLRTHMDVAIGCAAPAWPVVRRLHAAWVAAGAWERARRGVSR